MKRFEAVNFAKNELCDFENPVAEAEWIVALSLNVRRGQVHENIEINESDLQRIVDAVEKRKKHIPIAYIFGTSEFCGYLFKVNENCLIPRPETEELVMLVSGFAKSENSILDIGTGSGAIAVSLNKLTNAKVTAVDVSKEAVLIAKENAKINNANVEFIVSNLFENVKNRKFDIIVSNPPYISYEEYEKLDIDVKNYEPKLALVADDNGLDFYKRIIKDAKKHLNENGKIFFEVGYNQAEKVCELLKEDYKDIKIKKDLEGVCRMVYATMK